MKKYRVNVNGTVYEVGVELIGEGEAVQAAAAPKAAPAAAPAPAAPVAAGAGQAVKSPMPGTILAVNVKEGETVKRGQVLVILEAMKMENEIQAPCDGVVTGLTVTNGVTVEAGTAICFVG